MTVDLTRLPQALRDRGLTVIEHGDWLDRGYDTVDFVGQVSHHTVISGPVTPSTAAAMVRGRSDLPGPLCNAHGGLDDRGRFVVYLIAGRRARHAGPGSPVVLAEFLKDAHDDRTAAQRGLPDDDGAHGNRFLFGWEWQHPGDASPWPEALLDGMGRCTAALAELAGWHPNRHKGHKHWTRRKIDPSWPGSLPGLTARHLEDDVPMDPKDREWIEDQFGQIRTDLGTVRDTLRRDLGTVRGNDGPTDADLARGSITDILRRLDNLSTGGGQVDYDLLADKVAERFAARLGNG